MQSLKKTKVEKLMLELIETSPRLRKKIASIFFVGKQKIVTESYLDKQLAKQSKEFDEKLLKQRQEISKEFDEKLLKQRQEISKEFDEKLLKQKDEIVRELKNYFDKRLGDIGSRWGVKTESSFRESIKSIFEKDFKAKIDKWRYNKVIPEIDEKRIRYEVDVYIIYDDKIVLVEYKNAIDDFNDVEAFRINIKAYEHINNRTAYRKVMICNYVKEEVREYAKQYEIEIISPDEPFHIK